MYRVWVGICKCLDLVDKWGLGEKKKGGKGCKGEDRGVRGTWGRTSGKVQEQNREQGMWLSVCLGKF